jgi:hypothetical protein
MVIVLRVKIVAAQASRHSLTLILLLHWRAEEWAEEWEGGIRQWLSEQGRIHGGLASAITPTLCHLVGGARVTTVANDFSGRAKPHLRPEWVPGLHREPPHGEDPWSWRKDSGPRAAKC